MLPHHLIFACVLAITHGERPPQCPAYAYEIAEAADKYAEAYKLEDEDLRIADCFHESKFKKNALGKHKEIGICQIKRKGAIQGADLKLSFKQLTNIDTNIRIAFAYMAKFNKCKPTSYQLSPYQGGKCRSTVYSRSVLADLKLGRNLMKKLLNKSMLVVSERSNLDNKTAKYSAPPKVAEESPKDQESSYQCRPEYDTSCSNVKINLRPLNQTHAHTKVEFVLKEPVVIEGVVPSH